jgi:hypothetical protein
MVLSTGAYKEDVPDWQESMFLVRSTADICASYKVRARIVPITSSLQDLDGWCYTEAGADITILSDVSASRIIALFEELKNYFGLHCVWLEHEETGYEGCIMEWPPMVAFRAANNLDPLTCGCGR